MGLSGPQSRAAAFRSNSSAENSRLKAKLRIRLRAKANEYPRRILFSSVAEVVRRDAARRTPSLDVAGNKENTLQGRRKRER